MRSRLVLVLAVTLAVVSVVVAAGRIAARGPTPRPATAAALPTRLDSYLGVYAKGPPASYGPVVSFAAVAGRQPNLAGYFSGWAEPFKTMFAATAYRHGAATIVQLDPTGASIEAIAAGDYDGYLRDYADAVRRFGHPVVLGFGHEMNATWYSWGYGHVAPRAFVAAWRHLVTLFRQQGADNVTWLWTVQADIGRSGPVKLWWPGAAYVTWVGIDGYYYRPSDTFVSVFGRTIAQVRSFTARPVLISETAVGPAAGQPAKIQDLFRGLAAYQVLGLMWFDIAQHSGIYHQDWRLEDSTAAGQAFRAAVRRYLRP